MTLGSAGLKRRLARLMQSREGAADKALLLVRVLFGLTLALAHGSKKLTGLEAFVASVAKKGILLPELLAPLAMMSEFLGGLLLALGLLTRVAALFVLGTMLVAAVYVHAADPFSKKELALAYAAVALALFFWGAGRHSLDAWLFGRSRR